MVLLKNQVPITIVLVFIVCLQCFGSCDEDKKDQPTSGESFVAVPVSGVGTKEELNPKLVGLINISKLYLPQEYEFKEIISATREIVAGVRYTIQVKARDDNKLETECQLVILEKPWLHNNWGDKIRELEKSNCTSSSGALNIDGLQTGVTDGEYKFGTMFNPNPLFINSGGLTPEKVTHVDAQVMTFNYKTDNTPEVVTRVPDSAFSDCTDNVPVVVTPPPYVVDVSQITYYNSDTPLTSDNDQNVIAKRHETETANKEEDIVAEGSETVTEKGDVPTLGGIESTGHTEVAPYTDDLISHFSLNVLPIGGLSSIQVGSITNVTKQVVAGISYKGTILYLVKPTDYTQKMYTVTCDFNIWIRSWLEPPMDKIISETCDTSNLNQLRQRRGVAGGVTSIKPSELSGFTNLLLDAALKGDVAKSKVEIVSITNTTKQVVAGMLYTGIVTYRVLDDDQSQTLSCNFKIWDRPWLKIGEKVSLTCDGKELVAFEDNNTRRKRSLLYDRRNPNYVNEEELRLQSMFNKFVADYGKSYANVLERAARYRIFKSNLVLIDQLNRNELGTAEYGITEFADLTTAEYKLRTGLVPRPNGESNDISKLPAEIPDNVDLPKSFDWREKNAVTPVKNQGSCGSCWAFSVTGNIEGLNAIKTGKLDEFSEQELLDCDTVDSACNGGLPDNAYQAIEKIGGLEYESEYPYKAKKDTCKFSSDKARVKLSSSVDLPKNETAMALWLIQNGPISIGINANAMQFYRGGVSHPWKVLCLPSKIDHGVLIVGYGVVENVVFNKTMPYWIVKNSWGTTWGEQGYYRIFRGTNACGVSEMASSAILA